MSSGADPADGPAAGEVRWTEDDAGPLLAFTGRIDRETVRRFRLLVPPASWPARADLSAVTALDVAGLELLVHLARKPARTGSRLELLQVPERLRPAIDRAGLSQLLPRPAGS
ncbi:lipid asymmetry maintenance protein MlaB [Modestobacter sp. SSW1-42]|uniref:STAS domain-containing protein n=1 Tax=Modestobacter sp. SSW1-42 TaxID=596372 RepID=UPI003987BB7E